MRYGLLAILAAVVTLVSVKTRFVDAQPFSEIVVFGDSDSDTGNWAEASTWTYHPAYLVGRFSNGPVWVEEVASQLNLPSPSPSEGGGLNYAWGGARTGYGYDSFAGVSFPKVGTQVAQYLANQVPHGDELVTLLAGFNDFDWGGQRNPTIPVQNVVEHTSALAMAGVQSIVVANLYPMGHYPGIRGTDREALLDSLTLQFNELLAAELAALGSQLGVKIVLFDLYGFGEDVIEDAASFGFVNVTDPAFSNDAVVPNPDEYLYWDEGHFTAAFHRLMSQQVVAMVVPEPSSVVLSVLGMGLFVLRRYRLPLH